MVGAGRIAQVAHLPAASKADRVHLIAVCDPSPVLSEQVAARYGVGGVTELDALLSGEAGEVDAVLIAAPDRLHLALAAEALAAGKHVLVEKPLAGTLEDAEGLAELAGKSGCKLQVGAMKRHDPGIEHAKAALKRIGPLVSVQAWYRVMSALRPATEATLFPATIVDPEVREVETAFKADRERYLLTTHGAHVFDGIRYLAGEVASLRAEVGHVGKDFSWHGTARLAESGGLCSFEISANVHAEWAEGFDLYGERGHVAVRCFFPFFRRASAVSVFEEEGALSSSPSFGDTDPYERQLEAFARAVLDDEPCNPDAAEGVAAVRFIEAVRESAAGGGVEVAW
ncbi:MAG: Gfo/Idh/MocA family protein [Acidimicrobiales bacterium]